MNMRRNTGGEIGGAAAGINQVPPQVPAARMEMPVNPTGFADGEVRTTLVQMAQSITLQTQSMTAQAELRDFTRVNPPVYPRSKIAENLEEECREFMLHDSMDHCRLMVHVQQVEDNRKRKHTKAS
ncbi:hypothetical protein EJD97_016868 [Solanum chilense]|uniref:Uncharacterized protein n=1 Tax=Solanum chilense TaxID=4083 RepID=A0A6N2B8V4_SOLCI|nr:hypothetical protein EJD97_016868 [Solanum chilense]